MKTSMATANIRRARLDWGGAAQQDCQGSEQEQQVTDRVA